MSPGCFSWCRLRTQSGAKEENAKPPETPLAIVPARTSVRNQLVMEPKSDEGLFENSLSVVPTTTEYITASGKQALALLESAAKVIPVPFLQDAIGVALKIIELCEEASAVEEKVKDLQDRVCHLMVVIVDNVTAKNEEGSEEAVVRAAKRIERDIKELLSTLTTINKELTEVREQNRWLTTLYKDLNLSRVESCLDRLSTALEKFKLANNLRDSDLLQELHARLGKIHVLTQQVANKVDDMHADVKDIKQILAKTRRSATLLPSNTVNRQQIPLKPEIFHGRDGLVEEIAQLLSKEETSRICVLGPGGMGKTSVLLAVVELPHIKERFPLGNCVWVPCIEATSATILLEILYIQLQVPGDKQVTLEKIISELDGSKEPRLILLDNFETPWNAPGGTQKQVGDILRKLANISHVAILVTMRGKYPPCNKAIKWQSKDIQPTDEAACFRIYHDINPESENDLDVGRLLATLGHMPFAVTLMANLGMQGRSTAKELLDAWSKSGPDILPDELEQSMNRSISLSVYGDLVKRNPSAFLLLQILSLLPAGTTKENLRWWAPALEVSMIPFAIATLSNAALLIENKRQDSNSPVFFVLPVVQSFMQQHDRIPEELWKQIQSSCCQYVLDHACRYDHSTFSVKSKALAAEDTNIQSILFSSPTMQHAHLLDPRTIEALIAFCWHRCDTKPNLEIANHAVAVAEASGIERHIASAVWCVGRTSYQLTNNGFSYNYLQKAYQLFNSLSSDSSDDLQLQKLCAQCGVDLVEVACASKLDNVDEVIPLARELEAKSAALSDDFIHGRSLCVLGFLLNSSQQQEEAMVHLDCARTMLKAARNISSLAEACQVIALVHYDAGRFLEALDAIEEAWEHAESIDSPFIQSVISLTFGMVLFSLNRDTEAWKYIEIALTKASYIGGQLTIARALEYMGYGYLRRGDYQNAYGAYEAAAGNYSSLVGIWIEDKEQCEHNMVRIQQKQRNPDLVAGFYKPFLDHDCAKSLFFPPVAVFTSDMPIS